MSSSLGVRAPGLSIDDLMESARSVIGQEKAKQQLAVLLRRQLYVASGEFPSSTGAILAGPSGAGKTMLARAMCSACGLPYAEVNATQYTEKGYVGPDLSQAFVSLMQSAADMIDGRHADAAGGMEVPSVALFERRDLDEVIALAQTGVLLLDEFDKWMLQQTDPTGRDKGRALQSELLKIIEGSTEWVRDDEDELGQPFDTTRVLVICAGAFVGLLNIVRRRLEDAELHVESAFEQIQPIDFEKFGLLPELSGRLTVHIMVGQLTAHHFAAILRSEGGLLDEYRKRFALEGCELIVEDGALLRLSEEARSRGTGARGLRHVMERTFHDALLEASRRDEPTRVRVTAENAVPPQFRVALA